MANKRLTISENTHASIIAYREARDAYTRAKRDVTNAHGPTHRRLAERHEAQCWGHATNAALHVIEGLTRDNPVIFRDRTIFPDLTEISIGKGE